jgi:RimJ/RimL family protein N-acetyltransferase
MYKHKNEIVLRKADKQDLHLLLQLKNESWFGTHQTAIINSQNQEDWFLSMSRSKDSIYFIAEKDNAKVGVYKVNNIDWINRSYDSAHDVFSFARGQGYGYTVLEAGVDLGFEVLNMHRLNTEVLENNKASAKTALYAGYTQEGVRRKAVYKCGQWLDSITYGLLREDWEKLERVKKYEGVCNISYLPKCDK